MAMTDANFQRHLKVLGKLCQLYDTANASVSALQTLLARTIDQVATGEVASLPGTLLIVNAASSYSGYISAGPTSLKAFAVSLAAQYFALADFQGDMATVPASQTANAILTAFATEMGSGVSNKTLTTLASTGLVNFFNVIAGATLSWHTSGSPDYPDSSYVVSTIV